jgi:hypothetical protein
MGNKGVVGQCKLCQCESKVLHKSHILSKFFFENSKMFNENHFIHRFKIDTNSLALTKLKLTPDAIYQMDLFCKSCEEIMRNYETVLRENIFGEKPNDNVKVYPNKVVKTKYDYASVKLGLLSNLYRMAISNREEMSAVNLDKKIIEELRVMIFNNEPKQWFEFPILMFLNPTGYNFFLTPIHNKNVVQLVLGPILIFFIIKMPHTVYIEHIKQLAVGDKLTLIRNIPTKFVFEMCGFKNFDPII